MLRRAILGVAVCFVSAGFSLGQQFQKPGPEHEKMKEFVGTWDAVMEMAGQKTKGTATYRSICGGMWLASDFEGDLGGLKFQGHGVDGYDQRKKKYVGTWFDSLTSAPLHFEGSMDPKTKLIVMTGESVSPDGKPEKFKNTTEHKDKEMYMVQPDGQEALAFTIEYTRRK
jgi:hypothetical protein